ncbi:hypothetical protein FEM03_09595 [Phragmitibacter flavus]|uniref:Uncharacterized protein n=1 Tax=Phragmitibacter flavus TaxID=2576071 RepID=A0A5R8KFT4_9BACT|nr:hypothetical protein [Phragmitibacter flavus]TLD71153.1 hypothetical protein FEM03_09595 [Phragmitibacter flavus]
MKPAKRPKRYKPDRLDASAITPEVVAKWWSPRFGETNPQRMNNPLWEWLVRTRMHAYNARERFGFPSPWDESKPGPAWCFARFGQSVTLLPDGRVVMIAGEHEDFYDPDFKIYNDVTVQHPDGSLDLYGYPENVFPPTDFHTATLVGDRIIIIGNNGYLESKTEKPAQVAELNLETWSMRLIETHGDQPGWLHDHVAALSDDGHTITIMGGITVPVAEKGEGFRENPDEWSLDLKTLQWRRLSAKPWETYVLSSSELRDLGLFNLRSLPWAVECGHGMPASAEVSLEELVPGSIWEDFQNRFGKCNRYAKEAAAELYQKGFVPDLEIIRHLYHPPVPYRDLPEVREEEESEVHDEDGPFDWDEDDYSRRGDDFNGTRIDVQGVVVRYKEEGSRLSVIFEGTLPMDMVASIVGDLAQKLELLVRKPVLVQSLDSAAWKKVDDASNDH